MRNFWSRTALVIALSAGILLTPRSAPGYSVLAHEAAVDALWSDVIVPILKQRFPDTSPEQLLEARAYAYGGSVIQDLGYYPFGSQLFTNLVHYVRSGDFVSALLRHARDVNEYAFAIGALAHYASDNSGHPHAVNRVVPLMYPKVRAEYGDEVLYVESRARHVMVEFAFDVSQVARGMYVSSTYRDFIGFEVAKRALEEAFKETYGLEVKDLFLDVDLAIGSYRRAVGTTIPQLTELAWREKQDEILKLNPKIERSAFVYPLTPLEYDEAFGTTYRKPGMLARFLMFVAKIVPKVGPFRPLAFEPLTPEAEKVLLDSLLASRNMYRTSLQGLKAGKLALPDTDFDTGQPSEHSKNPLAIETYAKLLEQLAKHKFAEVSPELRADLNRYYAVRKDAQTEDRKARKQQEKAMRYLTALNTATAAVPVARDAAASPSTRDPGRGR